MCVIILGTLKKDRSHFENLQGQLQLCRIIRSVNQSTSVGYKKLKLGNESAVNDPRVSFEGVLREFI